MPRIISALTCWRGSAICYGRDLRSVSEILRRDFSRLLGAARPGVITKNWAPPKQEKGEKGGRQRALPEQFRSHEKQTPQTAYCFRIHRTVESMQITLDCGMYRVKKTIIRV